MKKVPEQYRIKKGLIGSSEQYGNNGAFIVPFQSYELMVIASSELSWDHVSVSLKNRCPNWQEMCFIKDLFFNDDECVIQYHPPKSNYVNICKTALHLWRPQLEKIPMPPIEFV